MIMIMIIMRGVNEIMDVDDVFQETYGEDKKKKKKKKLKPASI